MGKLNLDQQALSKFASNLTKVGSSDVSAKIYPQVSALIYPQVSALIYPQVSAKI